jgi:hypothetical protein
MELASVNVEFQVKKTKTKKKGKKQRAVQSASRDQPSTSHDSLVGSDDTPAASRDEATGSRGAHLTSLLSETEMSLVQPVQLFVRCVRLISKL